MLIECRSFKYIALVLSLTPGPMGIDKQQAITGETQTAPHTQVTFTHRHRDRVIQANGRKYRAGREHNTAGNTVRKHGTQYKT
ncbi:UNVERIFIED_CONTAM: hypothetical protein FKN15_003349 [Acipenser sinensis]